MQRLIWQASLMSENESDLMKSSAELAWQEEGERGGSWQPYNRLRSLAINNSLNFDKGCMMNFLYWKQKHYSEYYRL